MISFAYHFNGLKVRSIEGNSTITGVIVFNKNQKIKIVISGGVVLRAWLPELVDVHCGQKQQ